MPQNAGNSDRHTCSDFLMGIMVLMDQLLQDMSHTFGWYVALILQVAICIGLYCFRYEVLGILSMATMVAGNPRRMRTGLGYIGNPYRYMAKMHRKAQRMQGRDIGFRGLPRNIKVKKMVRNLIGMPKAPVENR